MYKKDNILQTKYEQVWIIYMNEQMKKTINKLNINSVKLKLCQKM